MNETLYNFEQPRLKLESTPIQLNHTYFDILKQYHFDIFFPTFFSDKNAIVYNSHCGHMLRTKLEKSNEGGVAAGSGALDSPYLYDD